MAKVALSELNKTMSRVSLDADGKLSVINVNSDENYAVLLNRFLSENASQIKSAIFKNVFSRISLDPSWISKAPLLERICIAGTKGVLSDAFVDQVAKNDNIVNMKCDGAYTILNSSGDQSLRDKMHYIMDARAAKPKAFSSTYPAAFNPITRTWLPYDKASQKWKLVNAIYEDNTLYFVAPKFDLAAPAGIRLSKKEIIKIDSAKLMCQMKNNLILQQKHIEALILERSKLLELLENDSKNSKASGDLAEISGHIGRYKQEIKASEDSILQLNVDWRKQIQTQIAIDKEFFQAFRDQNFKAMNEALDKGADLYAQDLMNRNQTVFKMVKSLSNSAAMTSFLFLKEIEQFATCRNLTKSDALKSTSCSVSAAKFEVCTILPDPLNVLGDDGFKADEVISYQIN